MKYLAIIGTNITDPSWIESYVENVTPLLLQHGGKYLTRTDKIELIEGDQKPQFQVVTEFPSKEVAINFYNSEEYAPYKAARLQGSESTFILVPIENEAA
ncbi:MAG: DUF1330 domain-containing protein [Cellvibrionaceae bacterium]